MTKRKPEIVVCPVCVQEFTREGRAVYCSDKCKYEARRKRDKELYSRNSGIRADQDPIPKGDPDKVAAFWLSIRKKRKQKPFTWSEEEEALIEKQFKDFQERLREKRGR